MLLNSQWITEEIKEKIQNIPRENETKHNNPKPLQCSKSNFKREIYHSTILPQETRKIPNKQPNLTPKIKPKVSRRKEIIKIRAEINGIEILKK